MSPINSGPHPNEDDRSVSRHDHTVQTQNHDSGSVESPSTNGDGAEAEADPHGDVHETAAIAPSSSQSESYGRGDDEPELTPSGAENRKSQSPPASIVILTGIVFILLGVGFGLAWLTLIGALLTLVLSWGLIWPSFEVLVRDLSPQQRSLIVAIPALFIGIYGVLDATGVIQAIGSWSLTLRWDILGSFGDFLGAIGQIFVALLALFVAWRQYIISRDLTLQQNRITQQQTIDAYFQGISELVLDDEGLLEDWPQERIIAEARTAAILTSIDAPGKAKIIRFLSRSKLLTPLKRDEHLGRPILDGKGGYAEDRERGLRVINLGAILANADLSHTDLRWTDLSDVNLIRANLAHCDLVRANFVRAILYQANLNNADLMGVNLFYGSYKTASPRSRVAAPDFATGEHTGAVVEDADFSNVKRMSEDQRQYCCRWGGEKTRGTIPEGCEGIPNCLGR